MANYRKIFKKEFFSFILISFSFVLSFYFYNNFPDVVPTHWNLQGEADGFSGKGFAALFFPFLILFMYVIMSSFPFFDPRNDRYVEFEKAYRVIKNFLLGFLLLIYVVVSANGLGYALPIEKIMPVMVGLLFIVISYYLDEIKPNWFIGIRTPWTLSSEDNWRRTHHFSKKLFFAAGLIMFVIPFASKELVLPLFLLAVLLASLFSFGYSLLIYLKDKKNVK